MSLALYRRYRPDTFAELIGQEHVTRPLQQALRNNKVNHAYLFSGPRGCGKTTSARILARALNCEQGPTPTPCGTCASCRDLATGGPGSIDVIEIDAASHGGVDDARELRERAFFAPAAARYKIYIIDEAHMVTSAGFNALLKVVEEPPEHLKFIFATTEPEKVIGTIRSRTHHYPFRLVPPGVLRDHLAATCEREGVAVADGVLPLVVRAGAGSVRDSLSVLDQLLAGAGPEGVSYAMATALLGYTDGALLDDMIDAFAARDGAAVFGAVDRVIEAGHDPRRFVADLLERFRDLVILAAAPQAATAGLIEAAEDQVERMRAQAEALGLAELSRAAELLNAGLTEMRGATAPRLLLELVCARLLLPSAEDDEHGLRVRLERLERQASGTAVPPAPPVPAAPAASAPPQARPPQPAPSEPPARPAEQRAAAPPAEPAPTAPSPPPPPPAANATDSGGAGGVVRQRWSEILDATKGSRIIWILLNQNARVAGVDGGRVSVAFANPGARDSFQNRNGDQVLVAALGRVLGGEWRIDCIVDPSVGGQPGQPGQPAQPGQPSQSGPPPAAAPASRNRGPEQSSSGGPTLSGPGGQRPAAGGTPPVTKPPAGDASALAGGDWPTARIPGGTSAPASSPSPPVPPPRPTIAPEDDVVADDDPDLDDDAVSSHELLARELGARVIEEVDRG